MQEDTLVDAIQEIHFTRYDFAVSYGQLCHINLNEEQAHQDYSQWIKLHPIKEDCLRVLFTKKTVEEIYELIDNNLLICLTSEHRYLREFSRLIARSG